MLWPPSQHMVSGFELLLPLKCSCWSLPWSLCLGRVLEQAASDVYAPVSGEVIETNTDLADEANLSKVSLMAFVKVA